MMLSDTPYDRVIGISYTKTSCFTFIDDVPLIVAPNLLGTQGRLG